MRCRRSAILRPAVLALCLALCPVLTGCDGESARLEAKSLVSRLVRWLAEPLVSDLDEATLAMRDGEWAMAERHLERFLRTAKDPEERWIAWTKLIEATERDGQDRRWINEYLETMLVEFRDDRDRQRIILRLMAENQEAARDYERAISSWMQLVSLPGMEPEESLDIHKRLAFMQVRHKRLQGAADTLHECLSLPLPGARKAECLYSLAVLHVLRNEEEQGADIVAQILEIPEVDATIRAQAVFLLADIREAEHQFQEALRLFESIRGSYPNGLAVDARIDFLRKHVP